MNKVTTVNNALAHLSTKWQLSNMRPLVSMPPVNNYVTVAYSTQYQKEVVLKILLADTHEAQALALFDGHNSVKLLDYDAQHKGLLLEYVQPGTSLKTFFPERDAQALEIAAHLIKQLHACVANAQVSGFKTVNQWLVTLHTHKSTKIPEHLLKKAQQLSEQLLNSDQKQYLLHGDLHHENILQDGSNWIAIDPKGVLGPLEYELGRFIMNPIPDLLQQPNAQDIINQRITRLSEIFDMNRERLRDWTFVQAVLSACWTEQGGSEEFFNYFVKFAKVVELMHYS